MLGWLSRTIGALTTGMSSSSSNIPTGEKLVALAIKTEVTNYPFESTRNKLELVKGTVAACINVRGTERGVIKFIVREHGKESVVSKMLERVLSKPNPVQSRTDFLEMCSQFHDATGNAVLYFIKGDAGLPAEVWCLPSFFVIPIFNSPEDPVPAGYRWSDGRVIADNGCICMVRNNSLKTAPYTGRGFLDDQFDTGLLYDLVVKSQKNWFLTGGSPNVALVQPLGSILTEDQITAMQRMWNAKYNPATGVSNIAVLPDGVTPKDFGPNELDFNESKDEIRDSIREALQVPKIILGDTDNVNHNNGQTALAMFERLVVLRWGQKFANALEGYFQENIHQGITVQIDPAVSNGFTQLPSTDSKMPVNLPAETAFPAMAPME